jgi:hypothetical protein
MDTIKNILSRLAYKTTGFKSLFVIGVMVALVMHQFSPQNADVLKFLIGFVLGAKALQYAADAVKSNGR